MEFQLIVLRGRSASKAVKLAEGITTVGRQDDCQLRIASAQVSRKHCQLFEHKGHLLVKDLGSANGTFVNGQKVAPQRVLEAGDELAIGPIRFRIEKLATAGAAAAARPAVTASDTAVGPTAAGGQEPAILGAPVHADADPVGESNDFEVIVDDLPDRIGDDDTVAIEMDDEAPASPPSRPAAPAARPTPPPPAPKAPAEDKDMGDDAVADFLLSIKADDE